MLRILQSKLKCSPVRVGSILLHVQNRIPLRVRCRYFNKISAYGDYQNRSKTRNISIMFQYLEKDAIQGHIYLSDLEKVLCNIKTSDSMTVTQSLNLLRYCGSLLIQEKPEVRIELVHKIWKTMKTLGADLDISHYNILLKVYLENNYNFSPSDILNELVEKKIEPNYITYERIIMHQCEKGDIAGALDTIAVMREKRMILNANVYHALITGYSRINDMESAERILNGLTKIGIHPSSKTYSLLISGYIRQGNLKRVNEILANCEQRGIAFTETEAFSMIYEYAMNNYEYEVDKILKIIQKSPSYNLNAANFSLQLTSVGKPLLAYKIMATTNFTKVRFTKGRTIDYLFIVQLVRYDAPTDVILKCCLELMAKNVNPLALKIAMENSIRYGKTEIALALFNVAKQKELPIRMHYFWPLLIAEAKRKNVRGVFDIMSAMHTDFNLTADTETIRFYVIPHLVKQNIDVKRHLKEFESCGVPVSIVANSHEYSLLNDDQFEQALEMSEKELIK